MSLRETTAEVEKSGSYCSDPGKTQRDLSSVVCEMECALPEMPFLRNRIRLVHMRDQGQGAWTVRRLRHISFLIVPVQRNCSATIAENCVG